jgi:hypothetical protein
LYEISYKPAYFEAAPARFCVKFHTKLQKRKGFHPVLCEISPKSSPIDAQKAPPGRETDPVHIPEVPSVLSEACPTFACRRRSGKKAHEGRPVNQHLFHFNAHF